MISFFYCLNPIYQALIFATINFLLTAVGASCVMLMKKPSENILSKLLSISAGVMLASSIFSLLVPAISISEKLKLVPWFVCSIGLFFGALLLFSSDKFFKNNHDNPLTKIKKFIFSIVLHNIPEGMAVGIAFGSVIYKIDNVTIASAIALSIGIGIQNFPEGSAISFPLYRLGYSKLKSFLIGSFSAIVEPISAVIGALIVLKAQFILPYLLAFAAGSMLYVIIAEVIPESMAGEKKDLMALYVICGFIIMMILDISLG